MMFSPIGYNALLRLLTGNGHHAESGFGAVAKIVSVEFGQLSLAILTARIEENNDSGPLQTSGRELIATAAIDDVDGEMGQPVPHPDDGAIIRPRNIIGMLINNAADEQTNQR